MNRNVPYAIVFLVAMLGVGIFLMLWAMQGTSSGRRQISATAPTGESTEDSVRASRDNAIRVPPAPSNDASADSARLSPGPQNKSR